MELWKALLLGLVQGLTEFLPISSSGHLVFGNYLLGIENATIVFEVAVHVGTLVAVLVYFRKDLAMVIVDFFKGGEGRWVGWMIILGTIPTVIIGLCFKDFFESVFHAPKFAAGGLLVTSVLMFAGEKVRRGERKLTKIRWIDALVVGLLQGMAIMPGISRSGSTISAGLFAGLDRDAAARYSFLLSIPAILGALVLNLKDFAAIDSGLLMPSVLGAVVAAVSGYAAIGILMAVLRKGKLYGFVIYTLLVGIAGLIFLP